MADRDYRCITNTYYLFTLYTTHYNCTYFFPVERYQHYNYHSTIVPESPEVQKRSDDNHEPVDKWPANTCEDECIRRNRIIRSYIEDHDWYVSAEFKLIRELVMNPPPKWQSEYSQYYYIFDYEWVIDEFKGDLVYTDGSDNILIVEVKTMYTNGDGSGKTRRKKKQMKRRSGEEQTKKYTNLWHEKNPEVKTIKGVFVTDDGAKDEGYWLIQEIVHIP